MFNKILTTFPILTTERLTLRQPSESDVQEILSLRSDISVNKYLGRQLTRTTDEALAFIQKVNEGFKNNTGLYWGITNSNNKKLVGTICIFNFSDDLKTCEIGYELLPDYQRQGIMNEALKKILDFTFQTLEIQTIEAFTHKDNLSSTQLLEKFHFEKTTFVDEENPDLIAFYLSNKK
ncbi:GNAT family acetyltransferase [Chryseobacterium artocarpi]|uniref:GNAT family acetyltransferase n=1 Tax=Chryseobacterium artocarpi TaxID=1414727 RepID=A0A1B8ZGP4_9FLAO|nr:GNAT family acetyltransferase [Chryseobacterium artocarpi]